MGSLFRLGSKRKFREASAYKVRIEMARREPMLAPEV